MHVVVKSHLDAFVSENSIQRFDEAKCFEAFINYCVIKQYYYGQVDVLDHIYFGDDPGIDGIMFIVDGELVSTTHEINDIFTRQKKDLEVTILVTQSKSGEKWDKSDINVLESALIDFFKSESVYPHDEYIKERKEIFSIILQNVRKVKDGKPRIKCFYATSGKYLSEREILAAFKSLESRLVDLGYFSHVEIEPLERDLVIRYWVNSYAPLEARVRIIASALFPSMPEIIESYVITMSANEYVTKILSDENGNLRKGIFEENVRDFIGTDSPVNAEIQKSITDASKSKRFGILNNGVTIVSPDIRLQSNELYLENFQIVNGCQTSNVLWDNRLIISDDTTVTVKVVETMDSSVVDDLVKSTNNQTKVEDHQFLATLDIVKNIERYFVARSENEDHKIYFERRYNQFHGQEIPDIRIFDIRSISRCVGAMFFDRPDLSTRYPNQLTSELKELVFDDRNKEDIYYTAAYSLYRLQLHFSNNRIPPKYQKLKWFILMLIKYKISGKPSPDVKSPKIVSICKSIETLFSGNDAESLSSITGVCSMLDPFLSASADRIKRMQFVDEVRSLIR